MQYAMIRISKKEPERYTKRSYRINNMWIPKSVSFIAGEKDDILYVKEWFFERMMRDVKKNEIIGFSNWFCHME